MNQLYSFGPLAMISLCTSSANPLYMALSDLYWVYSKHFRLSKIIISFLGFMQVRIYPKTRIADCDRLKKAAKFARYSFANCSSSTSICRINEVLNTSPVSVSATATTAFYHFPYYFCISNNVIFNPFNCLFHKGVFFVFLKIG